MSRPNNCSQWQKKARSISPIDLNSEISATSFAHGPAVLCVTRTITTTPMYFMQPNITPETTTQRLKMLSDGLPIPFITLSPNKATHSLDPRTLPFVPAALPIARPGHHQAHMNPRSPSPHPFPLSQRPGATGKDTLSTASSNYSPPTSPGFTARDASPQRQLRTKSVGQSRRERGSRVRSARAEDLHASQLAGQLVSQGLALERAGNKQVRRQNEQLTDQARRSEALHKATTQALAQSARKLTLFQRDDLLRSAKQDGDQRSAIYIHQPRVMFAQPTAAPAAAPTRHFYPTIPCVSSAAPSTLVPAPAPPTSLFSKASARSAVAGANSRTRRPPSLLLSQASLAGIVAIARLASGANGPRQPPTPRLIPAAKGDKPSPASIITTGSQVQAGRRPVSDRLALPAQIGSLATTTPSAPPVTAFPHDKNLPQLLVPRWPLPLPLSSQQRSHNKRRAERAVSPISRCAQRRGRHQLQHSSPSSSDSSPPLQRAAAGCHPLATTPSPSPPTSTSPLAHQQGSTRPSGRASPASSTAPSMLAQPPSATTSSPPASVSGGVAPSRQAA